MIRRLALLAAAAAVAAPLPAHAHDTGTFLYRKWVWHGSYWMFEGAPGCGELPCDAHGYEHDDYGPIAGHQQGQSWDCKFQVFWYSPPAPTDVREVLDAAEAVAEQAAAQVYEQLPALILPITLAPPACPATPNVGQTATVGELIAPLMPPIP